MTRFFINFSLGVMGVWTIIAFGGMVAPTSLVSAGHAVSVVLHLKN